MKKRKSAIFLLFFFCLTGFSFFGKPKTNDPEAVYIEKFEKLLDQAEKQNHRMERYMKRHLAEKFGDFEMSGQHWERWFKKWDAKNVELKALAKQYEPWAPVFYDYFLLALRNMSVIAFEYRKYFYWEKSTLEDLKNYKKIFKDSVVEFREEIEIRKRKKEILQAANA